MKPTIPIQKPGALPVSIDQWLRSWPKFTKVDQSWLQRALKPTMLQQLLVCWGCFRHSHRDVGHSLHKSRYRRGRWDGATDAIPQYPRKICLETKSHWEYPILSNVQHWKSHSIFKSMIEKIQQALGISSVQRRCLDESILFSTDPQTWPAEFCSKEQGYITLTFFANGCFTWHIIYIHFQQKGWINDLLLPFPIYI